MANGTKINVLYFAQIAEIVNKRNESIDLLQPISAAECLAQLMLKYPDLKNLKQLKIAVNQEYIDLDQTINPGDEVALFEPVTGG